MSNDISPAEQDAEWLKSHMPDATDDEIEAFQIKVLSMWADGGMEIGRARDAAKSEVVRSRGER